MDNNIRTILQQVREYLPLVPDDPLTKVKVRTGWNQVDSRLASREEKKNFAQRFSDLLALMVADKLRPTFPGILPMRNQDSGDIRSKAIRGVESLASSLKGVKRLDVNFSTERLGLGLGVSIKTLNFRDAKSRRYTKNVSRIDNELRAEASDYHVRQPYAVLAAIVFLPRDCAFDAGEAVNTHSSFGHACQTLRYRTGRADPSDSPELFEKVFVALYEAEAPETLGELVCFDVSNPPPKKGLPAQRLTFVEVLKAIEAAFFQRNVPKRIWEDTQESAVISELEQIAESETDETEGDDD
ncbi:MAG: hypothetical protein IT532_19075 [Burkholderiales bacterium]|nr:hypothetical protein [Burkholderiales bacterium]